MRSLDASIVITARERFSHSQRSLENLVAQTPDDVPLIYVCAGAPPHIQGYLEQQSSKRPFHLITRPQFLSPNQARNLGLQKVHTKYVVFLDNDTLVTHGWLEALVKCANDTQASIVAPLYLIGELQDQIIHMAGGTIDVMQTNDERIMIEEHRFADTHMSKLDEPLDRESCDYIEFHCVLVRNDLFDEIGALDEDLLSVHEHIDISLAAQLAGGSIIMEPKSVISYVAPPPCEWWDLPFFLLRWSDQWTRHSVEHFKNKWRFSRLLYSGDEPDGIGEDTIIGWGRGHRRLMTGLVISEQDFQNTDLSPFYQSALMLALFESVDRGHYDIHMIDPDTETQHHLDLPYSELIERLPDLLKDADEHGIRINFSIQRSKEHNQPALFCIEDLNLSARDLLRPLAFLILERAGGRYDCWFAIARDTWQRLPRIRHLFRHEAARGLKPHRVELAGTSITKSQDQIFSIPLEGVNIFEAKVGHLLTASRLEKSAGLALFESGVFID